MGCICSKVLTEADNQQQSLHVSRRAAAAKVRVEDWIEESPASKDKETSKLLHFVLLGDLGAGKSTVANALLGTSTSGNARFPAQHSTRGLQATASVQIKFSSDHNWHVVDTPGLGQNEEQVDGIMSAITHIASTRRCVLIYVERGDSLRFAHKPIIPGRIAAMKTLLPGSIMLLLLNGVPDDLREEFERNSSDEKKAFDIYKDFVQETKTELEKLVVEAFCEIFPPAAGTDTANQTSAQAEKADGQVHSWLEHQWMPQRVDAETCAAPQQPARPPAVFDTALMREGGASPHPELSDKALVQFVQELAGKELHHIQTGKGLPWNKLADGAVELSQFLKDSAALREMKDQLTAHERVVTGVSAFAGAAAFAGTMATLVPDPQLPFAIALMTTAFVAKLGTGIMNFANKSVFDAVSGLQESLGRCQPEQVLRVQKSMFDFISAQVRGQAPLAARYNSVDGEPCVG